MNGLNRYFELMEERPYLFDNYNALYVIEKDRKILEEYMQIHHKPLGVVYESAYHLMVVDLIKGENGFFCYERLVHTALGRGVVCIVKYQDKMILLKQYRHALRKQQLAFVRGFGEGNLSAAENAKKEVEEELRAKVKYVHKVGEIVSDSGLSGSYVDVFVCEIDEYELSSHEGIMEIIEVDELQLQTMIQNGELFDGYSLSAYMLYQMQI